MAETILIDAQAGTLPEGFCPKGPTALQQLYDQFVESTQWSLAVGIRFFNFGDTEPTPDLRGFPWIKTVNGYPDRTYVYSAGQWLSLHAIPAGPSGFRCGWVGTEDELKIYDEGDSDKPTTLTTGPFWEIDHDFDGRSPMGPGDIPSANPAKTLSVGEDYGEGAHTQLANEVGPHQHTTNPSAMCTVPGSGTANGIEIQNASSGDPHTDLIVNANTYTSVQEAMPIIHPVRGLYQIKRTIRKYYRGT